MSEYTQDGRLIAVNSTLGKDALLVTSFEGTESISSPFQFQLEVVSKDQAIKPEDIIGTEISVTIGGEEGRVFHGQVERFSLGGGVNRRKFRRYQLTMVPWLSFLSRTEGRRIFQNKHTKEIVSEVFADLGFSDFKFHAKGSRSREYCVQYGESDLQFVSRLLEEEGYAYYFSHEATKHTLMIVEAVNAYEECGEGDLSCSTDSAIGSHISAWQRHYEFRKGSWTLNDYDFMKPDRDLRVESPTIHKYADNKKFTHYEYPGLYDPGIRTKLVQVRMQAEEVEMNKIHGESNCSAFYAGSTFELTNHAVAAENGKYTLLRVSHEAKDNSHFTDGTAARVFYSNTFTCIPADVHYRPPQVHQRPVMRGPQSAVVTGPEGEEVYIDGYGRIKVQFIWDREGKKDENSSCFLRVTQAWAGNNWGSSFIPRIGHEVIVSFLDGDPDRPIVTGSVYNGANKPPYRLSKTESGIKTHSTPGGTSANYNELRFEDQKGGEQIYIHAEKDLNTMVEHDETLTVDHDRIKTIENDETSEIKNDRRKTVNNNQFETIRGNKTINVTKDHDEGVKGNMTIKVDKDLKETVTGQYIESVTKDYALHAKTIRLDADDSITIKTGSASIVMKSNGDITLSGKTINIKGSGNVVIKGSKVITN